LESKFEVERDTTVGIAEDLNSLARLFEKVISCPEPEFKAGRVVIMGLINHVHCLLVGGLQAVESGNAAVWSNCARGLIETLGACVLISQSPLSAPSFLQYVSPRKLYDAAASARSGLKGDVKRLHQIVHPVSGAIFAGRQQVDTETHTATFEFGMRQPSAAEGREGVIYLGNLAVLIVEKFEELSSNTEVLSAGSVIMERSSKA
jgi:hypothetical protein